MKMDQDKKEIMKLKVFREWVKEYRKLTEEEKEKLWFERWKEKEINEKEQIKKKRVSGRVEMTGKRE